MHNRTLAALNDSIEHWKRLETGTASETEGVGAKNCALCKLFRSGPAYCVGCPVMRSTGQSDCDGSPYPMADDAYREYGKDSPEFRAAAKIEREFLEGLLPKQEETAP